MGVDRLFLGRFWGGGLKSWLASSSGLHFSQFGRHNTTKGSRVFRYEMDGEDRLRL